MGRGVVIFFGREKARGRSCKDEGACAHTSAVAFLLSRTCTRSHLSTRARGCGRARREWWGRGWSGARAAAMVAGVRARWRVGVGRLKACCLSHVHALQLTRRPVEDTHSHTLIPRPKGTLARTQRLTYSGGGPHGRSPGRAAGGGVPEKRRERALGSGGGLRVGAGVLRPPLPLHAHQGGRDCGDVPSWRHASQQAAGSPVPCPFGPCRSAEPVDVRAVTVEPREDWRSCRERGGRVLQAASRRAKLHSPRPCRARARASPRGRATCTRRRSETSPLQPCIHAIPAE